MDWTVLRPELGLGCLIILMLLLEVCLWPRPSAVRYMGYLGICGTLLVLSLVLEAWDVGNAEIFWGGMFVRDAATGFFEVFVLVLVVLTLFAALAWGPQVPDATGEAYLLIMMVGLGMMLVGGAADLLMVFLGLELMSLALYALPLGFSRSALAHEVGLKSIGPGIIASGLGGYGLVLVYGATGSTSLTVSIGQVQSLNLWMAGNALLLVWLGTKMALVPFHTSVSDIQQGISTGFSTLLNIGPKAAGFWVALRIWGSSAEMIGERWAGVLWMGAVLGMTLGNLLALNQRDLKRLLAYVGVAQTGYWMVGWCAGSQAGYTAVLFNLIVYALAVCGAFGVVLACPERDGEQHYRGFGRRHPVWGAGLACCLWTLAGLPPTAGFSGRFYLFFAAFEAGQIWLAVLGLVNSAVSAYICLNVLARLYARPEDGTERAILSREAFALVFLATAGCLGLALWPAPLMEVVGAAAAVFL